MYTAKFLDDRWDIVVKYLFIKSYVTQKKYKFYKKLYLKHIKYRTHFIEEHKKSPDDYVDSFKLLIDSIVENWFNSEYPIEYNNDKMLVWGAHRLSCCLYFNIDGNIKYTDKYYKPWWKKWFKNNHFSKKEIHLLKSKYKKYLS